MTIGLGYKTERTPRIFYHIPIFFNPLTLVFVIQKIDNLGKKLRWFCTVSNTTGHNPLFVNLRSCPSKVSFWAMKALTVESTNSESCLPGNDRQGCRNFWSFFWPNFNYLNQHTGLQAEESDDWRFWVSIKLYSLFVRCCACLRVIYTVGVQLMLLSLFAGLQNNHNRVQSHQEI